MTRCFRRIAQFDPRYIVSSQIILRSDSSTLDELHIRSIIRLFYKESDSLNYKYLDEGVTAEYPATLYHHCFRWSAFFEERSRTQ